MKKFLVYTAGLIALYIGVEYYPGTTGVLSTGGAQAIGIVKTLQGR